MEWHPLYAEVAALVGTRAANLFCYAISTSNSCLVCSTFFRQILADGHETPDELGAANELTRDEQLLLDFGQAISTHPNDIDEDIYTRLKERFDTEQLVLLIGFAGQMVATNYFNMVAKVDLDDVLLPYATPEFLAQVLTH
jgi:alkylhydroperoxidase family enzyme